jgi:hypothetical protein
MLTTAVPLVYAEALIRTAIIPATLHCHVPVAVAEVAAVVEFGGKQFKAAQATKFPPSSRRADASN